MSLPLSGDGSLPSRLSARRSIMRLSFAAVVASGFVFAVAACAPRPAATSSGFGHPNSIIVREFAVSGTTVVLDPSFGFSLYRGQRGVPPRARAASVGRAAAFEVADAITQGLRAQGYDALLSGSASPEPEGRTLIVSGLLRYVDEGRRRRVGAEHSRVVADYRVEYAAAGAPPQPLLARRADSLQAPAGAAPRAANVNAAARRAGEEIARAVAELARRDSWPGASR